MQYITNIGNGKHHVIISTRELDIINEINFRQAVRPELLDHLDSFEVLDFAKSVLALPKNIVVQSVDKITYNLQVTVPYDAPMVWTEASTFSYTKNKEVFVPMSKIYTGHEKQFFIAGYCKELNKLFYYRKEY